MQQQIDLRVPPSAYNTAAMSDRQMKRQGIRGSEYRHDVTPMTAGAGAGGMTPQAPPGAVENPGQGMTKEMWLNAIKSDLARTLVAHGDTVPAGFNRERFLLNAMSVVGDRAQELKDLAPESIVLCLAKGAYLGLDFLSGECHVIPYKGIATFLTDYKGEIKLAKKYSTRKIKDVYAKNVREGDFFEEMVEDGRQSVRFKPRPFSTAPIIGTFAVILFDDGGMSYETMSVSEIEGIRNNYSRTKGGGPWSKSTGEMYKKTVLRRLLKTVELDFSGGEQGLAFYEGAGMDFEDVGTMAAPQGGGSRGRMQGPGAAPINDSVPDVFADSE